MAGTSGKSRVVVVAPVALIAIGAGVFYFLHHQADDEVVAGGATRGTPALSGPLVGVPDAPGAPAAYKGPPITGVVHTSGGQPVAGARVTVSTDRGYVQLPLGPGRDAMGGDSGITSADGQFQITPGANPRGLIVRCPDGFAFKQLASLPSPQNLVLQPWGRIDGTAAFGPKPAARAHVLFQTDQRLGQARIFLDSRVQTDAEGHFTIEQVPPGKIAFGVVAPSAHFIPRMCEVEVAGGATVTVRLGGDGRPVVGRVTPSLMAMSYRRALLRTAGPGPQQDRFQVEIDPEGNFRMDDVPAGAYALSIECGVSDTNSLQIVGTAQSAATVHPIANTAGYSDAPFDLGTIPLKLRPGYSMGGAAPNLSGVDTGGNPVQLTDFAGKYVLLSVVPDVASRTWLEVTRLRAVADRFRTDPRFVMLVFYAGESFEQASQTAVKAGVRWPIVHANAAWKDIPELYRTANHPTFMIDPHGNLIAPNLDHMRAASVADRILSVHGQQSKVGNLDIRVEHVSQGPASGTAPYLTVPPPAADDAATGAILSVVDGQLPQGPNPLHCLNDGLMPTGEDERDQNFRFAMGTLEGRVRFDLKQSIPIAQINSYSWHTDTRAPQLYQVFGSNGDTANFDPTPRIGIDPAGCGWARIADVDARPAAEPLGGRYAVSVSNSSGLLGTYRYLLFVMFPTETDDEDGHTFYSEIDVIRAK